MDKKKKKNKETKRKKVRRRRRRQRTFSALYLCESYLLVHVVQFLFLWRQDSNICLYLWKMTSADLNQDYSMQPFSHSSTSKLKTEPICKPEHETKDQDNQFKAYSFVIHDIKL